MDKYLFFWGHSADNSDGYLSNWYASPFKSKSDESDIEFKTSEHYMMYYKAKLMGDNKTAEEILKCMTPKRVKALGRKVYPWDEDKWIKNRERIMYEGCLAKFSDPRNEELKDKLIATYPKILVEASPYDKIWGIGMRSTVKGVEDPKNWKGLNLLGKALNRSREKLMNPWIEIII